MAADPQFRRRCLGISVSIIVLLSQIHSQTFWEQIETFPGEPKTGIAIASGSCLFVGLTDGIITRCDEESAFELSLTTEVTFTVFASRNGDVYAGGAGKVFFKRNSGTAWDSVSLDTPYPVTQIIENSTGDLFAITGVLDIDLGYLGDGVFYSTDHGLSWEMRNNGLGIYRSCERIAIDKNDRLYVCLADEFVSGNAGLFVSDDNGLSWDHITMTIDGRGVIDNTIKIGNTMGLSVSPADSLYFSFAGTAVNAGVTLNTSKHIDDVQNTDFWHVYPVFESVSWWLDRPLQNIFFASNGDWYSSVRGSVNTGGTYYSRDQGLHWKFINYSIGVNIFGLRSPQVFVEHTSGRIYMSHLLDPFIYSTDSSLLTSIEPVQKDVTEYYIYPNPIKPGGRAAIGGTNPDFTTLQILDINGRPVAIHTINTIDPVFKAPVNPGVYLVNIPDPLSRLNIPLVVIPER